MSLLPKLMSINPLFFNFYNSAYPNCEFKVDEANCFLTVKLEHSTRTYRIEKDFSIKY